MVESLLILAGLVRSFLELSGHTKLRSLAARERAKRCRGSRQRRKALRDRCEYLQRKAGRRRGLTWRGAGVLPHPIDAGAAAPCSACRLSPVRRVKAARKTGTFSFAIS
ncbi:hypothetical protein M2169_006208 [Streptomyces sp. MJP52]|nr:hypothetical protein [Streptomyces sp. MJP52]